MFRYSLVSATSVLWRAHFEISPSDPNADRVVSGMGPIKFRTPINQERRQWIPWLVATDVNVGGETRANTYSGLQSGLLERVAVARMPRRSWIAEEVNNRALRAVLFRVTPRTR